MTKTPKAPTAAAPAVLPLDQQLMATKQEAAGECYCRCATPCQPHDPALTDTRCPTCKQCQGAK